MSDIFLSANGIHGGKKFCFPFFKATRLVVRSLSGTSLNFGSLPTFPGRVFRGAHAPQPRTVSVKRTPSHRSSHVS